MKNICFISAILLLVCLTITGVYAQKAYLSISTGYGFKMSTSNMADLYMFNYTSDASGFTTREQINLSLGKGFVAEGSYGYMFVKNVSAELAISYLDGGKTKSRFTYPSGNIDYSLFARMLRFAPSVVIKGNGKYVEPYGKLGFVTGLGSIFLEENSNMSGTNERRTTRFKKGMAVGLTAGIGLISKISKRLSLITEINMVNQSFAPEESEVTKYTADGANNLDKMAVSERYTVFYDSIKLKEMEPYQPRPALKQKLPFGSFGLKLGLQFNL